MSFVRKHGHVQASLLDQTGIESPSLQVFKSLVDVVFRVQWWTWRVRLMTGLKDLKGF